MFLTDLSLPSPDTLTAERFWRAGRIFHLGSGTGNLLGQRNVVRSGLFSAEAWGGWPAGTACFY